MDFDIIWDTEDETWILTDGFHSYDLADWAWSVFGPDCPDDVLKRYADECLEQHGRAGAIYWIDRD